jgi:hypothetical protein
MIMSKSREYAILSIVGAVALGIALFCCEVWKW